jgi:Chlorophyll A-B binding protein
MTSTPTPADPKPTAPNPKTPTEANPSFGWNDYAERINGRFAMIGIISLLILEIMTKQTLFSWIGLA